MACFGELDDDTLEATLLLIGAEMCTNSDGTHLLMRSGTRHGDESGDWFFGGPPQDYQTKKPHKWSDNKRLLMVCALEKYYDMHAIAVEAMHRRNPHLD